MEYSKALTMLGLKFYDPKELEFVIYRVINVDGDGICTCRGTDNSEKKISADILSKQYTKLTPDGIITFFLVNVQMQHMNNALNKPTEDKWMNDVIVIFRTFENIREGIQAPDIVCRQNATDLQYCLLTGSKDSDFVGFCLTRNDVPENVPMGMLTECDSIEYAININTYINDNDDTIMSILGKKSKKFDQCLESCLKEYIESKKMIDANQKTLRGHCRSLRVLLDNNNFWFNLDNVLGVTKMQGNFDVYTEIIKNPEGKEFYTLNSDGTNIFSNIFGKHLVRPVVVKYDHDVDLNEIPKDRFFLFRDGVGDLYIVRYNNSGEYAKEELESEVRAQSFSEIDLHNKYGRSLEMHRIKNSK